MINGCVNDALVSCWVIINDILKTFCFYFDYKKEKKSNCGQLIRCIKVTIVQSSFWLEKLFVFNF